MDAAVQLGHRHILGQGSDGMTRARQWPSGDGGSTGGSGGRDTTIALDIGTSELPQSHDVVHGQCGRRPVSEMKQGKCQVRWAAERVGMAEASDLLTSGARLLPDPPSAKSHAHAVLGTAVQRSSSGRRTCTCGPAALRRGQEQHGPRLWAGHRFSVNATLAVATRGARRQAEVHA